MTKNRTMQALVVLSWLTSIVGVASAAQTPDTKLEHRLDRSRLIFERFREDPSVAGPGDLIKKSKCIAVFPNLIRAAFVLGGRHGTGVLSCRSVAGVWSPPAFLKMSEGSLGLQLGYQSSDVVLFFLTDRSAKSLMTTKVSLGADVSLAAGSVEKNAGVTNDRDWAADVYIYSQSRGLFAGAAFQGSRLAVSQNLIRRYYERQIWVEEILLTHKVPMLPPKAREFMNALDKATN